MSRLTYRHTIAASYLGYITQAIVNNLAPLLFVTFMSEFSLTLEQITMMTTVNFAVQLLVDLLSAKLVDRIGYTSIIPPPMAYSTTAIISPVMGGRMPGRIAMPDKPNTASTSGAC